MMSLTQQVATVWRTINESFDQISSPTSSTAAKKKTFKLKNTFIGMHKTRKHNKNRYKTSVESVNSAEM